MLGSDSGALSSNLEGKRGSSVEDSGSSSGYSFGSGDGVEGLGLLAGAFEGLFVPGLRFEGGRVDGGELYSGVASSFGSGDSGSPSGV